MVFIFSLIASCFIKLILFYLHLCCTQWGQILYELLYFCHFLTSLFKVINFQKQTALSKKWTHSRDLLPSVTLVFQRKRQQGINFASEDFWPLQITVSVNFWNRIHTEIQMLLKKVFDPIVVDKFTRQLMSYRRLSLMNQKY